MLNGMKGAAFAAACVLTLWSCAGDTTPPPSRSAAAAPAGGMTKTTVIFGGGYVFAFGPGNTSVEVGAMHVPTPSVQKHAHPMVLAIGKGDWDQKETTIPIQNRAETSDAIAWEGWDLSNYEVQIKPGGTDPQEPGLTVPAYSEPGDHCAPPTNPNNWFYIPEVTRLAAGSTPNPKSKDLMMTRIPLSRGTLAVNALAPGCFTFVDASGKETGKQLTAHGREGVTYTTNNPAAFVDLVLTSLTPGKPGGKIRLIPDGGELIVTINTRLKTVIVPKDPNAMKFFDMYYDLVVDMKGAAIGSATRPIPVWDGGGMVAVTPGGECPPVSVGYQ